MRQFTRIVLSAALLLGIVSLAMATAVPVKVVKNDNGSFQLLRDGKPYFIKGAGGDASKDLLKSAGGNCWRTWGTGADTQGQLDQAQKLGMTVCVGYWIGHVEQGMNWHDAGAVARQKDGCRAAIMQYKDSPALLMWDWGNEMENNGSSRNDPVMWQAIEDIAKMCHDLDPNHPTMVTTAEIGGDNVANVNKYCPDIDIMGINTYAGCASIPDRYVKAGGVKPYVLTEYGPPGTWEVGRNAFGAAEEWTSTEKAKFYADGYTSNAKSKLNLGSFAFAWGSKREATDTWFGMIDYSGEKRACVDALTVLWTGKEPDNHCPAINKLAIDNNEVGSGDPIKVTLDASDADKDTLKVKWVLNRDAASYDTNGGNAAATQDFTSLVSNGSLTGCDVKAPSAVGIYRLYVYIYDGKGGEAVGNKTFHVHTAGAATATYPAVTFPFVCYSDSDKDIPFKPDGGIMSNNGAAIPTIDLACKDNPHSGTSCIKIVYNTGGAWGGIAWMNPAGNWAGAKGGFNLKGATKLTFWARTDTGGEKFGIGYGGMVDASHDYFDSSKGSQDFTVTKDWAQYTLDLTGKNMDHIVAGLVTVWGGPGHPFNLYLDDIQYEGPAAPKDAKP